MNDYLLDKATLWLDIWDQTTFLVEAWSAVEAVGELMTRGWVGPNPRPTYLAGS